MNKSIKVQVKAYEELERLRAKRETFSDVVERLLLARRRLVEAYYGVESPEHREERLAAAEQPEVAP